ncbi:MAG: 4Fe-4S dicluster domain-containing protein [Candidatus Aminicenantes bacterium]|nr:4Fe-4S dicluster domain-containing protein [Candidatus Aminicenantes bacterium]
MRFLSFVVFNALETLLRLSPFPCKTGLIKIGNTGKDSPVFLTCNFHLTVQRVKRALKRMDAFLLVANSRGINVWCAAAGGHLTNHEVISVLKTSGIEDLVAQKKIILPQLAAPGVEANIIKQKTGWRVIWGPVNAKDIPHFLKNNLKKTKVMSGIAFPWTQRLEMAIAWAFFLSVILSLIMIFFWPKSVFALILLVWGLSFIIFLSFPLYSRFMSSEGKKIGSFFSKIRRMSFQLLLWIGIVVALSAHNVLAEDFSWGVVLRWSIISFVVIIILSFDLAGSTPTFRGGLLAEKQLEVVLDKKDCRGAGFCEQVCPRNCFEVDKIEHTASMIGRERCIQCGACIVQCPFDALHFESLEGEKTPPEIIRKFKLNLLGSRLKKSG